MGKCRRPGCPCKELTQRRKARAERLRRHPCDCDYGGCSICKDRHEDLYIKMHHAFIDEGIPYREHQDGVFIFEAQNGKEFFFWPSSGKWRQKGKTKVYMSRGAEHVLQVLGTDHGSAQERTDHTVTEYWLIKVHEVLEPELEGPFPSDEDRLRHVAVLLRVDDDFEGDLYRLDIKDGKPSIESFAGWEL